MSVTTVPLLDVFKSQAVVLLREGELVSTLHGVLAEAERQVAHERAVNASGLSAKEYEQAHSAKTD